MHVFNIQLCFSSFMTGLMGLFHFVSMEPFAKILKSILQTV